MEIKSTLVEGIRNCKKSTIDLVELERLFSGERTEYEVFAEAVLRLEQEGVIEAVKSHGRNGKPIQLAYQYRIRKYRLQEEHVKLLHKFTLKLHPLINLDAYYGLGEAVWISDMTYIERVDSYLKQSSLPTREAPAPERSFELVGDEKWITDKGGQALLERLGLWDRLLVIPVSDPLMMAVNPSIPFESERHLHLIVENKTTFQGLLGGLSETSFSTLIYGCGRKIVGNMGMFRLQYPVNSGEHQFIYFGDIDLEGILIWYDLQNKYAVQLALPFYTACMDKPAVRGKENHRWNEMALTTFTSCLPAETAGRLEQFLRDGCYIPQETLKSEELMCIGRSAVWNSN